MLPQQGFHQRNQLTCFAKAGEQVIFFQFLVIVLNELADDGSALNHRLRWEILIRVNTTNNFVIRKQHALQNPMLAH